MPVSTHLSEAGPLPDLSFLHLGTRGDWHGTLNEIIRPAAVEDDALAAVFDAADRLDAARRLIAATRLVRNALPRLIAAMDGDVYGYALRPDDDAWLIHGETLFGTDHPGARDEVARLAGRPERPYADDITKGLIAVVRYCIWPGNMRQFGLPRERGRA